jgi:hypothetical protein
MRAFPGASTEPRGYICLPVPRRVYNLRRHADPAPNPGRGPLGVNWRQATDPGSTPDVLEDSKLRSPASR